MYFRLQRRTKFIDSHLQFHENLQKSTEGSCSMRYSGCLFLFLYYASSYDVITLSFEVHSFKFSEAVAVDFFVIKTSSRFCRVWRSNLIGNTSNLLRSVKITKYWFVIEKACSNLQSGCLVDVGNRFTHITCFRRWLFVWVPKKLIGRFIQGLSALRRVLCIILFSTRLFGWFPKKYCLFKVVFVWVFKANGLPLL